MKNMTVERGAKLYKKGTIKPWKVDLLRGPDENYVCIASPYDEKKILIMPKAYLTRSEKNHYRSSSILQQEKSGSSPIKSLCHQIRWSRR